MIVSIAAARETARKSAEIHRYFDQDNELGFSRWSYGFGRLQVVAVILLALVVLAGQLLARSARPAADRPSRVRAAGTGVALALFLNAALIVSADRGRNSWMSGTDPSNWMNAAAGLLAAQALLAAGVGAWIAIRRRRSNSPVPGEVLAAR